MFIYVVDLVDGQLIKEKVQTQLVLISAAAELLFLRSCDEVRSLLCVTRVWPNPLLVRFSDSVSFIIPVSVI